MWEANEYKLYFDLNDGQWGNTDTYKGTTYVATGSATDAFDDVNYDAAKNMYWMDVVYGDKLNSGAVGELPNPTRAGYTFDGWFMRQNTTDASKKVTGDTEYSWEEISYDEHDWTTYVGAKDAKVYAKWSKNKYTIEFLAKPADEQEMETPAGSIASINMEFDIATTTVIEIPKIKLGEDSFVWTIDGYTYKEASIDYEDYDGKVYSVKIPNATKSHVISDPNAEFYNLKLGNIDDGAVIQVVANWQEHNYKIEYNANVPAGKTLRRGATKSTTENILYTEETEIEIPDSTLLSIDGYKFMGWATISNPTKEADVVYHYYESYNGLSKLASKKEGVIGAENDNELYKLYAFWMKNPYFVVYDVNNDESATPSIARQTFETDADTDQQLTALGFKVPGFTFDGWRDLGYRPGPTPAPQGWKATYSDAEVIPVGKNIRIGDSEDEIEAEFQGMWTEHTYTIDFDYNPPVSPKAGEVNYVDGTKNSITTTYTEEQELGEADVKVAGYEFDYWTDPYGNVYHEEGTITRMASTWSNAEHITLTYHWKKAQVTILLDHNDGENETEFWTYFDASYSSITPIPTPTRNGYTFVEWTTIPATPYETVKAPNEVVAESDIVRHATPSSGIEGDPVQTLYAHWRHNDYTLILNANTMLGVANLVQKGTMSSTNRGTSSIPVRYERPVGEKGIPGAMSDLEIPVLAGYHFMGYVNADGDDVKKDTLFWAYDNAATNMKHRVVKMVFVPLLFMFSTIVILDCI